MKEQQLIETLEELKERVASLDEWSSANARKLEYINEQFLGIACSLLEMVGRDPASFLIQQDDTNQEVGRAQSVSIKKKSDLAFHQRYYDKAKRHLIDEIPELINVYIRYKEQGLNK